MFPSSDKYSKSTHDQRVGCELEKRKDEVFLLCRNNTATINILQVALPYNDQQRETYTVFIQMLFFNM